MGLLYSDIHVNGWLKPTLTVELVAGGSLLANTKYYVMGLMGYTAFTYLLEGGPLSDVHEITTTSTDRSIKITHKTYRNITAFADNGDNRTLVTCVKHCLADGGLSGVQDTIKIDSGSYAGTHLVDEWVDYDSFIIDTPYVDNVPVQCYTDSQYYNRPYYGGNTNMGMAFYISPESPYTAEGFVSTLSYWTRRPWTAPDEGNWANPTTYTIQPNRDLASYSSQPELSRIIVGTYQILKTTGSIVVHIDNNVAIKEIYEEVQASGFIYNCGYSTTGFDNKGRFHLIGTLRATPNAGLSVYGHEMFVAGEMYATNFDYSIISLERCIVLSPGHFTAYMAYTNDFGVKWDTGEDNSYGGWVKGENLLIYGPPRAIAYGDVSDTYYDYYRAETVDVHYWIDKIIRANTDDALLQLSYCRIATIRCDIPPVYFILSYGGQYPEIYMMEDTVLRFSLTYQFHVRVYHYQQYADNEIDCLNIDVPVEDDANNHKILIRNSHYFNLIWRWWRRIEFYVQDDAGNYLSDALIQVSDGAGNIYEDSTDGNGYVFIDVLEQKDECDDTMLYSDPTITTYYTNFVVRVSKNGFEQDRFEFVEAYENTEFRIGLVPNIKHVEGLLTGDVLEDEIYGVAEETDPVSASMAEDTVYATIIEDTITAIV